MKKAYILLGLLLAVSFAHAKGKYTDSSILAYSDAKDSKYSGKVLPTTAMEVIKVEGDKALVKIKGWNQGTLKRILYYSKGERIISAAFSKNAEYEHKVLKTDKSGKKPWSKVEVTTWVQNKNMVDDIKPLYKKAESLFQTNCSFCHPAPKPKSFTANQWPAIIDGMISQTPLNGEEGLLVTQFVQKHAK